MQIRIAIVGVLWALPSLAHADQLRCNSQRVAQAAAATLPEGAIMLDYCSLCDDPLRVVRVRAANVVEDCQWELEVAGRAVWQSIRSFETGYRPKEAKFRRDGSRYLRRLDLAYVYIEVAPNDFRWLGGELGLAADVNTAAIALPRDLDRALGQRPLARVPVSPPARETPTPTDDGRAVGPSSNEVARIFDFWRGQGTEPVLAHFIPCLKLDLEKNSPTRFECLEQVQGPVPAGTKVYGWSDWLVPRGQTHEVTVEIVFDGQVRLAESVVLKGRVSSPIVPSTVAATLTSKGTYTLRLRRQADILKSVSVEVR